MKKDLLYVIDIRFKQRDINLLDYIQESGKILSLTPYSSYLLDLNGLDYATYHDIISIDDFKKLVLEKYIILEEFFKKNIDYSFLFRDFAKVKTFEIYIENLFKFFNRYKIVYITDAIESNSFKIGNNSYSYIYSYKSIDKVIKIDSRDNIFYRKYKLYKLFYTLKRKDIFIKVYNRLNKNHIELNYDNINYKEIYKKINIRPFTFLSTSRDYLDILEYREKSIQRVFMQHGSYIQENIFLKYNEIYPATINFVFNDFTKRLFENRGAKRVYSVGSINFNRAIKERKKEYDFLYILYCTSYGYSGLQIFSELNSLSIDGDNIYRRHKGVIELFGKELKDKKLVIKAQYGVVESMMYAPLIELSREYKNIEIEFFRPINSLIESSRYIISDYISSEFVNRDLHYKRDILIFNDEKIVIDKSILNDMSKLFILVNSIRDLKDKIEDIENISKNRVRDRKLIEYYSSKDCNSKKIVEDILKREFKIEDI